MPAWTTSCPDWADRLRAGDSIVPPPIFPDQADQALAVFKALKIVDAPGSPTFGDACAQWVFDLVASIFGAYDPESGRRLITEWFICLPKKNSKALALDTPIPTPSGWTTMGELQVGDTVFGADGKPCRVTGTSAIFTDHRCYRLKFSNGESVVADGGHLWVTSALHVSPGAGRGKCARGRRQKVAVRTTQEIADTLLRPSDGARNHSLAMPAPLQCPDADLPVSPYTLGAWLGDGHSACARLTCHDDDLEIRQAIEAEGWPVRWASNNGSKASTYSLSDGDRSQAARNAGLASKLRRAGVLNDKHIPDAYFRASYGQRLALLQGLMDTDGTINKNGRNLVYAGTNERLVRGVSELLSTFGIKATVIKRAVKCNGKPAGDAFYVQFMAFRDQLPVFRLTRKLDRMLLSGQTANSARSRTIQITAAEEVPSVPVKCITVDSPDHLFLFGRSMLPTHNSTIAAGIMMTAVILNWRQSAEFTILAPTIEVAGNSFAPSRDMVKHDDELDALMHVQTHIKTITHRNSGATLKVVAADSNTVSGKKSVGTLVDELWLFGSMPDAENMLREATGGLASRPEGFVIYLTTQSDYPPAGVFKQKLQYARDVRDGVIEDLRFVPVIFEHPPDMVKSGKHLLPENLGMVNPNLGYSVDEEFLQREFKKAKAGGEESFRGFLAKHANVEIGLSLRSDRWAGADFWERSGTHGLTLEALIERCDVIEAGIDGGGLDDLLGFSAAGRDMRTGEWLTWARAWAHPIVLERRKEIAPALRDFAEAGDLILCERVGDDVRDVVALVMQLDASGALDKIGVDPAGIGSIVDALTDGGIDQSRIVGISQGWRLNGAIKTTERKLAEGALRHGGSPMMAWCVGNARVEPRANSILITKQASGTGKIDPLMALFNAVSLLAIAPPSAVIGEDYELVSV